MKNRGLHVCVETPDNGGLEVKFTTIFVCLFFPSLSSCHEKVTIVLYFGRNCTRLGGVVFR